MTVNSKMGMPTPTITKNKKIFYCFKHTIYQNYILYQLQNYEIAIKITHFHGAFIQQFQQPFCNYSWPYRDILRNIKAHLNILKALSNRRNLFFKIFCKNKKLEITTKMFSFEMASD